MILSPNYSSIAVRRKDGSITIESERRKKLSDKYKWMRWPVVRGVINLGSQLKIGYKMLMKSADIAGADIDDAPQKETSKLFMIGAVAIAIAFSVGLFIILPSLAASFILPQGGVWMNTVEGVLRILIFIVYMFSISLMKDMKRVLMYHGAEHRVLHCFEHEMEPNVENSKKFSVVHPSCGTKLHVPCHGGQYHSLSLLGTGTTAFSRVLLRILLLPLVAGLSYEVLKAAASHNGIISRIVRAPGLLLQRLSTRIPEDDMIEVAATAYKYTMEQENG